MLIDDYIEKITLQEELKNTKERLKEVEDENAAFKSNHAAHCYDAARLRRALIAKNEEIAKLNEELKKNPSAAPDAEWIAIHMADVETINKLNIQVHDLNNTITTLLDRLSKYSDENKELKKKAQELKDIIKDLVAKLYK